MSLQTTGEIIVDVPRTHAFAFVRDPRRLAACIPGCHDLRELDDGRYAAVLTSRVAFMTVSFNVVIEVVRMDPPSAIESKIAGDGIGLPGHVTAIASLQLEESGERRTVITYATDLALTGKLGGIGQPVFKATSAQLAREFGERLKTAIEADAKSAA